MHSLDYHIIAADLRDKNQLLEKLKVCGIDKRLPTLFIAECVLIYMDGQHSNNLLEWIARDFQSACFINYDPVKI